LSNLRDFYFNVVVPDFIKKKCAKNVMDVPKILKVVINMGFGASNLNKKGVTDILDELALISGQRPVVIKAKKSIAGFKIRQGFDIGCKVTLRKFKMYNFLDKLLFIVLPRVRDFRGIGLKSFDGQGNYSLGIKEHIVFPEIDYDKVDIIRGMDISIVTNASTDKRGRMLLEAFKFPFN